MSVSSSMLVATILAAGVATAGASPVSSVAARPSVSAYAVAAAQGDDVASKVKAALKADSDVGPQSDAITVSGAGGVITLEGTVPTVQLRAKVGEIVLKVDGVTKLNNKLKLAKK